MKQIWPIFKREFYGYFRSPVAYVVLAGFHLVAAAATFFLGGFFQSGVASLESFFRWLPWLFIILVPAAAMRLWAEERRSGTMELLFTLPVTTTVAVIAKFLAAWAFIGIAVLLTFPFALTVAYLGDPDWGVIVASYLGALLMAAAYLGICSLTSALTRNQVISFVIGFFACLMITLLGWSVFSDLLSQLLPVWAVDALSNFSPTTHFDSMLRGLIDLRAIVFFVSVMFFALFVNVVALER